MLVLATSPSHDKALLVYSSRRPGTIGWPPQALTTEPLISYRLSALDRANPCEFASVGKPEMRFVELRTFSSSQRAHVGRFRSPSPLHTPARRIPIPGFKEFGVGDHESHPTPALLKELGFKHGVVTTGNSFDHTEMDDKIMEENGKSGGESPDGGLRDCFIIAGAVV